MQKRGQATIFIIIGMILLAIFAGALYVTSLLQKKGLAEQQGELPLVEKIRPQISSYVESCIRKTAEPSVYLLAVKGGVIYPDEDSKLLLMDYGVVNYAWINGQEGLSRPKMEQDLSTYLKEFLYLCTDFEPFAQQGITVIPDYRELKADFSIKDNFINIQVDFPLTVTFADGQEITVDTFSTTLPSNFGMLVKAAESLSFPKVDLADLAKLPYQPVIFPFDQQAVIYSLTDEKSETPLTLMFAVRDDHPENQPPKLDFIPDQTFRVGGTWNNVLTAQDPNNDKLQFSSNVAAVPVSEDGTINTIFTQAGTYKVLFKVKDSDGLSDRQEVTITILPARENVQQRESLEEIKVSDPEIEALYVGE